MMKVGILVVGLVFRFSTVFGETCPGCRNGNCNGNGYCKDGCINGYYGVYCDRKCPVNCQTCTSDVYCMTCKDGYVNDYNNNACAFSCYYPKCKRCSSYYECSECKDGFSGSQCDQCVTGKYGTDCHLSCSTGCLDNVCSRDDGACLRGCNPNFQGNHCNICDVGLHGSNCEFSCPARCYTCKSATECYSCESGYYGVMCENNCNTGCKDFDCRKESGECVYGCKTGYSGSFCDSCTDGYYKSNSVGECRQCKSNCTRCTSEFVCSKCRDGLWGVQCSFQCPDNCVVCSSDKLCSQCITGFYGNTCTSDCPQNCRNKQCYPTNGTCLSCNDGLTGRYCETKCPLKCAEIYCSIEGSCFSCKPGFYGSTCNNTCPNNCLECMSNNMCSSCKTGFYGNACQDSCFRCQLETACRQSDGYCITNCKDGWYGYNCDFECDIKCKSCRRNSFFPCTSCKNGLYGIYSYSNPPSFSCFWKCPGNCLNNTCDGITGNCVNGCTNGFWGNKCDNHCPSNCINEICFAENGTCSLGCKDGFSGSFCNCPINCECNNDKCTSCKDGFTHAYKNCTCRTDLCKGGTCTSCSNMSYYASDKACCLCSHSCKHSLCETDSYCSLGCESGFYHNDCSKQCRDVDQYCRECPSDYTLLGHGCTLCDSGYFPYEDLSLRFSTCQGCSINCRNRKCDSSNGTCIEGCENKTWGEKCEMNCQNECIQCNRHDGGCEVCEGGKYKTDCSASCSESCNITNGELLCAIYTGACLSGCRSLTQFGLYCDKRCSENCTNNECEWRTGKCHGCVENHWGDFCEHVCSENCKEVDSSTNCSELDGHCLLGCKNGYYSERCDQTCSTNCLNNSCDSFDGKCLYGCIGDFADQQCTQAKVQGVNDNEQNLGTIGGSIGGAIVIIIIGIVIGILLFKRRRNIKEKSNSREEAIRFSEVDTRVREADLHDSAPVYAMPDKSKVKKEPTKPHSVINPNYQNPPVAKKQDGTQVTGAVYENTVIRDNAKESSSTVSYTIPSLEGFELELEDPNENAVTSSKALLIDSGSHITESEISGTYYYTAELLKRKIPLDKLAEFVGQKTRECFEEEFKLLPEGLIKTYTESQKRDNITKNRYRGIYPYDVTRVVLRDGESDYINASYIDGYKKLKAYIASLGPTYKYMDDMSAFWRMIWQEKCGKIIMLTNFMEAGTRKCDQYWPQKDFSQLYADINVTCLSEEQYADYTVRVFNIQKDSAKRTVTQVHFTAWPDQGVPDDVTCLIEFRQRVVSVKTNLDGPILVHCSAGIGRTGTYIALDSLTKEGESEGSVDIYACVRNMREQRVNMIQTAEQYEYLHKAVVHSLTFESYAIGLNHFQQYMKSHDIKTLAQKFQDLEHSVEKRSKNENEAIKKNSEIKEKNRVGADIPGDRNRPRLYLNLKPGASDYINALNVNGYRHVNRFILAQTPLPGTVDDFLTLVVQEKCSCIVNVEQETNKSKDVGIYYPADNQTLNRGPFTVRTEKGTSTQNVTHRRLTISNHGKARTEDHIVQYFQLTSWVDGLKCPDDAASFLDFLHHVELKSGGAEAGPILVHCLTGAEKCGLFCVVSILLEKVQCDQEVSVVNTVRQVKSKRHMVIPNKEQYIFCHQCVNEYIRSFDNYSNFASRQ